MSLIFGKDEATIFREGLEVLEDAARLEGLDDSDVEVAVAQFRRDVASILADVAENGIKATDVLEPPPMELWGLCQACQRICPVGPDDCLKGHQSRYGGRCDGSGREPAWTCSPPGYED